MVVEMAPGSRLEDEMAEMAVRTLSLLVGEWQQSLACGDGAIAKTFTKGNREEVQVGRGVHWLV